MGWKKSHTERVNDVVRDTLKKTHLLEEHEVEDLDKDVFFTLLRSPSYLGPFDFEPTPNALHRQYTPFRSARWKLHEKIVTKLFDTRPPLHLVWCIPHPKPCLLHGVRCKLSKATKPIRFEMRGTVVSFVSQFVFDALPSPRVNALEGSPM
jgi:hypothetical protein